MPGKMPAKMPAKGMPAKRGMPEMGPGPKAKMPMMKDHMMPDMPPKGMHPTKKGKK